MNTKVGPLIAAQRLIPFLAPLSVNGTLQQEQFDLLMNTMKMMLKSIEEWRKDEFQSQAEVAKQLEQDNQQDFIKHKNFEDLVGNEFREKQTSRSANSTNHRTISNTAPPSEQTISSFEELIREEEAQRQKHLHQQSQSHIFSDIGGAAVSQQQTTGKLKNLQISDNPASSSVATHSSGDLNFSSFSNDEKLPPSPKPTHTTISQKQTLNSISPALAPQKATNMSPSKPLREHTQRTVPSSQNVSSASNFSGWGDASAFQGLNTQANSSSNPREPTQTIAGNTSSLFDSVASPSFNNSAHAPSQSSDDFGFPATY